VRNNLGTLVGCNDGGVGTGIPAGAGIKGNYLGNTTAPTITNGVMVFKMDAAGTKVSSLIAGDTVTLSPTLNGGSIQWTCTSSAASTRVPASCR
jgi:type IV pilus assembly protein PilA